MLLGFVVSLVWVRPEQPQNETAPVPYPHLERVWWKLRL
jgi:hypothetical protein